MTRPTRRDIERRLDDLQSDDTDADTISPDITIRHFAVDADGETVGQAGELRVTHREDGTQSAERETYGLPNDRRMDQ